MTLLEVRNQLISHFQDNVIFSSADEKNIHLPPESEPFKSDLIRAAFVELEKAEMVVKLAGGKTDSWALTRSFSSFGQNIPFSPDAIEAVANVINRFIEANELDWPQVDKMNLDEMDIMTLVEIIHEILATNHGADGQDSGKHGDN